MTKQIRMLEFGAPKTGKTSSMGTYPGPVCLMNFDVDGFSSIHTKKTLVLPSVEFQKQLKEGVTFKEDEVIVLDYSSLATAIQLGKDRPMTVTAIKNFIDDVNVLFKHCPFKTVVVDPVTMWDGAVNDFIAGMNSVTQLQIQHWGQAAKKKEEIINCINSLPTHTIFLAHEDTEKDELTGQIRVIPFVTGQMKNKIGMMFSQFVYATTEAKPDGTNRYVLWTQPKGIVRGIGVRWPQGTAPVVDNNFASLFGGKV